MASPWPVAARQRYGPWRAPPPATGGVPGGVRSPGRATLCLPHGREEWCAREGQPGWKGRSVLRRFADAVGIGCARAADAQTSLGVCPQRVARWGRRMPPTKTTWVVVRKPQARQAAAQGNGTGELLGFPHDWARPRRGFGGIKRRPARQRLRRPPPALWPWWRPTRHASRPSQYRRRCAKRRGPLRYDGMRGPCPLLANVRR
jgi:hypothetical protein